MFAITLQAQTVAPAAGASLGGAQSLLENPIIVMIPLFAIFYLMIIRPQQKRMKEHQALVAGLKRGDTVVLNSGVIGKVVRVEDKEAQIEIAPQVTVKVVKSMVTEVRTRTDVAANDAKA